MIRVTQLVKEYVGPGGLVVSALRVPSLLIANGVQVALAGPSGSGKTTLLQILAGLTRPTSGRVALDEVELTELSGPELDRLRAERIGYVFQNLSLLESLTALENVLVAAWCGRRLRGALRRTRTVNLLDQVGLAHRAHHFPPQLSRGEQQRVAIARALVNGPGLVLADEPTASLDQAAGRAVLDLLQAICRENRATLIVTSHDPQVLGRFGQVLTLRNGLLEEAGPAGEEDDHALAHRLA
jgi:putative ABC transport system ATP-binding protein